MGTRAGSIRRQVDELRRTMAARNADTRQTAAEIGRRFRVNDRVAWRYALNLTQQQAADLYNRRWPDAPPLTGKKVSYWECWDGPGHPESPSARAPSVDELHRLAAVYGCGPDDLLGGAPARPSTPTAPGYADPTPPMNGTPAPERRPEEDDTNRRELLTSMTSAGLVLAGVRLPFRFQVPDKVTPEHVEQVRRLTETYRGWIYQHGASGQLQRHIADLFDHVTGMTAHASDHRTRTLLLDATADVANLSAYTCRDLGQHDLARQGYLLSVQAARAAGDEALAGHAVVRMAGHNIELARPNEVLSFLDAARRTTAFTPAERSNQSAIEAWAHAQTGAAQSVHRAVGHAEEQAALADDRDAPGYSVRHLSEAELYSLTGAAYAELARHDTAHAGEAIRRLTTALRLRGIDGARNATLDRISLAEAHLADHDLAEALETADAAVLAARRSSSRRVRVRLRELAQELRPHRDHADTADVVRRIRRAVS